MKQYFTRMLIMTKRSIKQPLYASILLLLILMTVIYVRIPEKEKSIYIPVAILNCDESENAELMVSDLTSQTSVFTFYSVSQKQELYDDILSGKADMGYVIPEGFFDSCTSLDTIKPIQVFVTEGTLLKSLANEEFYSCFFRYAAPLILKEHLSLLSESENLSFSELCEDADMIYNSYLTGDEIFSVEDATGGSYAELNEVQSLKLPIRKIAGFFIFTAAMLGAASSLYDREHKLYLFLPESERNAMNLIQIAASVLPISLISFICLLLIQEMQFTSLIIRMLIYMISVTAFAYLVSLLFKKSTSYYKVLPVLLILTFLFSGIFFDLADFDSRLKNISMIFLPYYF